MWLSGGLLLAYDDSDSAAQAKRPTDRTNLMKEEKFSHHVHPRLYYETRWMVDGIMKVERQSRYPQLIFVIIALCETLAILHWGGEPQYIYMCSYNYMDRAEWPRGEIQEQEWLGARWSYDFVPSNDQLLSLVRFNAFCFLVLHHPKCPKSCCPLWHVTFQYFRHGNRKEDIKISAAPLSSIQ